MVTETEDVRVETTWIQERQTMPKFLQNGHTTFLVVTVVEIVWVKYPNGDERGFALRKECRR